MANTYTQIHIQAVFSVQDRSCLIKKFWKDELYQYITGIIQNYGHKILAINGMPDHIHVFFGMRPTQSLSDLMQNVKGSSSQWINEKNLLWVGSHGKKDMALFRTVNHMLILLLNTL
ncbi:MAG: IS200/IS605 family transposase [Mangrovibacterium sp.]